MSYKKSFLLFFILSSMLSLNSARDGAAEVKNWFNRQLNKVASECSEKGVAIGDIEPTISACLEGFDRAGAQEHEDEEPQEPPRSENREEYNKAVDEYFEKHRKYTVNAFCSKLNNTLDCLQPLKTILDECKSSEGITMFKIANVLCQTSVFHSVMLLGGTPDINEDICARSEEFQAAFDSCGEENGLYQIYGGEDGPTAIYNDLCGAGTAVRECLAKGAEAGSPNVPECQVSSRNLDSIIGELSTGGSEAESAAVSTCLLGGSSAEK